MSSSAQIAATPLMDRLIARTVRKRRPHGFSVADGTIGSPSLDDVVPVAGTFITQRSLTGQWSVEVSLDGATIGRQVFQMEP